MLCCAVLAPLTSSIGLPWETAASHTSKGAGTFWAAACIPTTQLGIIGITRHLSNTDKPFDRVVIPYLET
jgi:hypothetical protein